MGCFSCELVFRILAFFLTFAAAYYMFVNKETADIGGFKVSASYKSSPAFKFFVGGNATAALYSLLSMITHFRPNKYVLVFLLDFLVTCLVIASASAASSIGYVGKFGNDEIGWPKVCVYYEGFCKRVEVSIAFSYVGLIFFFIMCACSYSTSQRKTQNINP